MIYTLYPDSINTQVVDECVERFLRGEVAIIPTDSVYAVAGDFQHPKALEKLAKIKGESVKEAEFSFLFTDLSQVSEYTQSVNGATFKFMKRCLPGPYTLVLESNINVSRKLGLKRKTIGVRIPDQPIVQALAAALGRPLASASLHHDDEILQYPTDPDEISATYLEKADFMIDGGWGDNTPSTVIDLSEGEPTLIRAGKGDPDII
jgi:tRNA threonylcarbamoyl adenosine modification protein (Sua5/YciO/YrdC/YwlC family)